MKAKKNRMVFVLIMSLFACAISPLPAQAEINYSANLPQFGGNNTQAFNILTFEKQQADAEKARRAAAIAKAEREAAATTTTNADRLISAITSYLNAEIARKFSSEILNGEAPSGNIKIGDVSIEYIRSDGILSLVINDVTGSTTIELPVIN